MLLRSASGPILGSGISFSSQADLAKDFVVPTTLHAVCRPPSSCHSPVPLSRSNSASNVSLHTAFVDIPRKSIQEHEGDPSSPPRVRRAQSEGELALLNNGSSCVYAPSILMSSIADDSESASGNTSSRHKQWAKRISSKCRTSAICRENSILEESELLELGSENDEQENQERRDESSALSGGHRELEFPDDQENSLSTLMNFIPETVSVPKPSREFLLDDGETYTSLGVGANGSPTACNSRGCRPLTKLESEKLGFLFMANGLGLGTGGGRPGGNGWNGHGWGNCPDSNSTDAHYQGLLRADPQNPLLLRNYAQYLNEVEGDSKRSEEYLERAILACPSDGDVLAQYAKLQWDVHRDQERAESYYDQAVQAAPDDCHVMASYASFLWDSEDNGDVNPSPSPFLPALNYGSPASSPLMASV